jgi:hypothetical protein
LAKAKIRPGKRYYSAYNSLADIYKAQNRPDSALLYLQLANTAKDSLMSNEKIKQLQNIGFDEQLRLQELEKESLQTKKQNKDLYFAWWFRHIVNSCCIII